MQANKKHIILLKRGLKIVVSEHEGFGYIDYTVLPKGRGRPTDWDIVSLALAGASYDTLLEVAEQRDLGSYIRHRLNGPDKAPSHREAFRRRVERAMKQAEDIEAEITHRTGLTLRKASTAEIAKQMKFFAELENFPLPER